MIYEICKSKHCPFYYKVPKWRSGVSAYTKKGKEKAVWIKNTNAGEEKCMLDNLNEIPDYCPDNEEYKNFSIISGNIPEDIFDDEI